MDSTSTLRIEPARPQHAAVLLALVRDLARFEKLEHQVVASEHSCATSWPPAPP